MYGLILVAHILAATLWTGGHLILAVGFLPGALRSGDIGLVQRFERRYEPIGLSALAVQVGSGLWLAHHYQPNVSLWSPLEGGTVPHIGLKLVQLALTVALACTHACKSFPDCQTIVICQRWLTTSLVSLFRVSCS